MRTSLIALSHTAAPPARAQATSRVGAFPSDLNMIPKVHIKLVLTAVAPTQPFKDTDKPWQVASPGQITTDD